MMATTVLHERSVPYRIGLGVSAGTDACDPAADVFAQPQLRDMLKDAVDMAADTNWYRRRGADTLTCGDQTRWISNKLTSVEVRIVQHCGPSLDDYKRVVSAHAELNDVQQRIHWADLETAAERRDAAEFGLVARRIDWEHAGADDIERGVRLSLAVGAHIMARDLSELGARRFPGSERLVALARLLSPPCVVGTRPAEPTLAGNRDWLSAHAADYRGQWVALRDGTLLAAAPSVRELKERLGSLTHLFVTRVL